MVGTIIHIRGAFSVARFDLQGNAKAFMRGTSIRTGSTFELSFVLYSTDNQWSIVID